MLLDSILNHLQTHRKVRRADHGQAGRRPRFEAMEDRCLLSLTAAVNYTVGVEPQAVVAGDFNNDGRLDIATANHGGGSVSLLLGNGQGGFEAAVDFPTGDGPNCMAVGDFNNDGKLDLVTGINGWGARMLLGNGDGTFQAPVWIDSGYWRGGTLAAADLNRDGHADLVLGASDPDFSGLLEVQFGDGQGEFAPGDVYYLSGYYPYYSALLVADLNTDGSPDVVAVNESQEYVSVLINDGWGNLTYTPGPSDLTRR